MIKITSIMGQVNHGKTTLVSKITKKQIYEKHQITQSSKFYFIDESEICLIDTPGHHLFHYSREVAFNLSDVIIIVLDITTKTIPNQTMDIFKTCLTKNISFVICLTKIDLVSQEMFDNNLLNFCSQLEEENIKLKSFGGAIEWFTNEEEDIWKMIESISNYSQNLNKSWVIMNSFIEKGKGKKIIIGLKNIDSNEFLQSNKIEGKISCQEIGNIKILEIIVKNFNFIKDNIENTKISEEGLEKYIYCSLRAGDQEKLQALLNIVQNTNNKFSHIKIITIDAGIGKINESDLKLLNKWSCYIIEFGLSKEGENIFDIEERLNNIIKREEEKWISIPVSKLKVKKLFPRKTDGLSSSETIIGAKVLFGNFYGNNFYLNPENSDNKSKIISMKKGLEDTLTVNVEEVIGFLPKENLKTKIDSTINVFFMSAEDKYKFLLKEKNEQ